MRFLLPISRCYCSILEVQQKVAFMVEITNTVLILLFLNCGSVDPAGDPSGADVRLLCKQWKWRRFKVHRHKILMFCLTVRSLFKHNCGPLGSAFMFTEEQWLQLIFMCHSCRASIVFLVKFFSNAILIPFCSLYTPQNMLELGCKVISNRQSYS